MASQLLENRGVIVNRKKSVSVGAQSMIFLGVHIDKMIMTLISVPMEKLQMLQDECGKAKHFVSVTEGELRSIDGRIGMTSTVV